MGGGRDFLALAEAWDRVVFLDEVVAFLLYRNKQDVHSNSDVSYPLRVIETFSGLLILTTCRPGVLEQGVESRVHLNICLRALNLEQTLKIFKHNIASLKQTEQKLDTPGRRCQVG
ncbi:hypothetical protein QBC47DRAFT_429289 [Echria macrotheca]|uniref:Uncharacterized protein n=1 Tax=Echria macrotheca TaxID=438768 RepID=A0AAJ0B8Z9_9PEZI|nr:hypothetical protein QBC47DRAFT_429289 [Echria macrotheca]